ncbi:MAG: hypothetical protein H0V16_07085 [Burkholderiaceae bacterium]|nr:hypothetical protein [Burkholderiaceae bacterium]
MSNGRIPQWAPNPYALAELLLDKQELAQLYEGGGEEADDFLQTAYNAASKKITITEGVELFRQLAAAVQRPMTTSAVLELVEAKQAAEVFSVEQIRRVLPYLVPLLDAEFAVLEKMDTRGGQAQGTWLDDAGPFIIEEASYLDPIQGAISDCYLISAMIALAWVKPPSWETALRTVRFDPPKEPALEWQFHTERGRERNRLKISGRLPVSSKKKPRYARSVSGESWPGMLEKAYVMKMRPADASGDEPQLADYQAIEREPVSISPPRACQILAGGARDGEILDNRANDAKLLKPRSRLVNAVGVVRLPVMAWTKDNIGVKNRKVWEKTGLWPNHAYALLGVTPTNHIVLRNPHGLATKPRRGYARGMWTPKNREPVELNKKGVFAISPPLFFNYFDNMGWVEYKAPARASRPPLKNRR